MARIIQLLEIDLNGATFRLELGGVVALSEKDEPIDVVRVDDLEQAKRLESLANALRFTFRWKEGHNKENAISVDDFQKKVVTEASRYIVPQRAASFERDLEMSPQLRQEVAEPRAALRRGEGVPLEAVDASKRCDHCGIPLNLWGKCDVCTGIEYNFPGKHD